VVLTTLNFFFASFLGDIYLYGDFLDDMYGYFLGDTYGDVFGFISFKSILSV